jgi:hypothetical protein
MIFERRGDFLVKNLLSLVLGGAIVLILLLLFFRIFSTGYDPIKETSKGYFNQLENSIKSVEDYGLSDYSPLLLPNGEVSYFLVYFGDRNLISDYNYYSDRSESAVIGLDYAASFVTTKRYYTDFFLRKSPKNSICICQLINSQAKLDLEREDEESSASNIIQGYSADSFCDFCFNLRYPVKFSVKNEGENIYDLEKNYFVIKKLGSEYLFEVKDR